MKILIIISCFLGGAFCLYPAENYLLLKSEADNLRDAGNTAAALSAYYNTLKANSNCASCHMEIGYLHMQNNLDEIALEEFRKAEALARYFFMPEETIQLYFYMASVLHRLQYYKSELEYLNKISVLTAETDEKFYRESAAKAAFITGMLIFSGQASARKEAVPFFYKSIDFGFRKKSCYYYLLQYFLEERNENLFRYYYQLFQETRPGDDEDLFGREKTAEMIRHFDEYYKKIKNNKP
ncbi:MAG: hypothetical protein A2096_02325 [Spirochaetes bacterium GWF1_41_5]|nr:MAG: hypothetical protein A2096_02325 [Spirochaetes bacterium GWF1_41_5]HBE01466.1 hypothetical protein [Spirochaetia bacterium]